MPGSARWRRIGVVASALVVTTSCDLPRFGAPDAATKQGRDIQQLWSLFFVIAAVVVLLVWGLLGYVILRSRARKRAEGELPSQKAYNIPVEIVYTATPILLVVVLFFLSSAVQRNVDRVHEGRAVDIEVVGFQWSWQFRYPGEGVVVDADPGEPPEMVIPVGERIHLRLVSNDVNHSFWVPRFVSKRDLIPGVRNEIEITPTKTGSYVGRCAEFCGLDHWQMFFRVSVVPRVQYDRWLQAMKAKP